MNPNPPPSDADLDRLLASRLRRTSPEFELRWRELRHGFVAPPAPKPSWRAAWAFWPGLVTAAVAVFVGVLMVRQSPTQPPREFAAFEELLALDAALAPATPLLDAENLDALLHLRAGANL